MRLEGRAQVQDRIDVDALIDGLIEREGGFVANPADEDSTHETAPSADVSTGRPASA